MEPSNWWVDVFDPVMDPIHAWEDIQATSTTRRRTYEAHLFSAQASSRVSETRAQEAWLPDQLAEAFATTQVSPGVMSQESVSIDDVPALSPFYGNAAVSPEQSMRPPMIADWPADPSLLARRSAEEAFWSDTEEESYVDALEEIRRTAEEIAPSMESVDTLPLYEDAVIEDPPPSYRQRTDKRACKSSKITAMSNALGQKASAAHQYIRQQVRTLTMSLSTSLSIVKSAPKDYKRRSLLGRTKSYQPLSSRSSRNV